MFLEKVDAPGIAHFSYIVGDRGQAAVIDPRRDCQVYLDIARRHGARITHLFETHRNEDYVIGSVELADLSGAEIHHGEQLPFEYGKPVSEGDSFDFGSVRLTVLSTPGHTFESISLALADRHSGKTPVAVFAGDALFIGDVGRTDFFPGREQETAGLLHDSIFGKLLPLGDHVIIYPAHGAGSVCGGHLSEREFSTIGYERLHNRALRHTDREAFIAYKTAERHGSPPYFARMEQYNLKGPPPLSGIAPPAPLDADEFASAMQQGTLVLDVRSPEAFGGAHIPGSLNIPLELVPKFAGWFMPYDTPFGLVVESDYQVEVATVALQRIGYDECVSYLEDGMHDWETAGRHFDGTPQIYVGEIKRRMDAGEQFTLLDVRSEDEFKRRHLQGAVNIYLGQLPNRLDEIPPARPVTTFCGSGHRASIAASILKQHGFEQVENCLGSMAACMSTACPLTHD